MWTPSRTSSRKGCLTTFPSAWGRRGSSRRPTRTCRTRSSTAWTGRCARATRGLRTRNTARSMAACSRRIPRASPHARRSAACRSWAHSAPAITTQRSRCVSMQAGRVHHGPTRSSGGQCGQRRGVGYRSGGRNLHVCKRPGSISRVLARATRALSLSLSRQVIDRIFDRQAAAKMGLEWEGQVCVMIHSGSRGLGHQVATDALVQMEKATTGDDVRALPPPPPPPPPQQQTCTPCPCPCPCTCGMLT